MQYKVLLQAQRVALTSVLSLCHTSAYTARLWIQN